jgi:hypothetical protein
MNRRDFMTQMVSAGTIPLYFHSFEACAVKKQQPDVLLTLGLLGEFTQHS